MGQHGRPLIVAQQHSVCLRNPSAILLRTCKERLHVRALHTGEVRDLSTALPACMQGKMTKNVERELLNHSMLIHPHVVRFEECFLTDKHLAIVMEYAAGGNLFTHVTAK